MLSCDQPAACFCFLRQKTGTSALPHSGPARGAPAAGPAPPPKQTKSFVRQTLCPQNTGGAPPPHMAAAPSGPPPDRARRRPWARHRPRGVGKGEGRQNVGTAPRQAACRPAAHRSGTRRRHLLCPCSALKPPPVPAPRLALHGQLQAGTASPSPSPLPHTHTASAQPGGEAGARGGRLRS